MTTHLEQIPEVRTAGREHHAVSSDLVPLAAERDVHQLLHLAQAVEQGRDAALEAVPLETELLAVHSLQSDIGVSNGMVKFY